MLGFPLGILSAAGAGGVAGGDYELIATEILGSSQTSVTFSNLGTHASTYKHLQIRATARGNRNAGSDGTILRFNGNSTTSYSRHGLTGNGTAVSSFGVANTTFASAGALTGATSDSNNFAPIVIDILDAFSTSKNKTTRALSGIGSNITGESNISLHSGNFRSLSSTTSIELFPQSGTLFLANSRFSIYGIKG